MSYLDTEAGRIAEACYANLPSRMSLASLRCRSGRTFAIGCHAERKASASMLQVSKIAVCRTSWKTK